MFPPGRPTSPRPRRRRRSAVRAGWALLGRAARPPSPRRGEQERPRSTKRRITGAFHHRTGRRFSRGYAGSVPSERGHGRAEAAAGGAGRLPVPRRSRTRCSTSARRSRCARACASTSRPGRSDNRLGIDTLVERVARIETIVTGSEVEALHLEQNLVKRHRPPFNVRLRDDKSFPYIAVTLEDDYPRVMFTRKRHRRGVLYFGPYANAKKVRETLDVLNRVFRYRPVRGAAARAAAAASRASTSTSSGAWRRASATSRRRTTAR